MTTWLRFAVLLDLPDEVAARLGWPDAAVALEMVCRRLYPFTQAVQAGTATDPITDLATTAPWPRFLKPRRPRAAPHALDARQRRGPRSRWT